MSNPTETNHTNPAPNSTAQPAPVKKTRRTLASQDQRIINDITEIRTALTALQANTEAKTLMMPFGYDDDEIAVGVGHCTAGQAAVDTRQTADATHIQIVTDLSALDQSTQTDFSEFRKVVRASYKNNPAALQALNATGRVPQDRESFITFATTAYNAALGNPEYMTVLSRRSQTQASLQAKKDRLTALTQASATQDNASAAIKHTTAQRDQTIKTMRAWWSEFETMARIAYKDRPDLLGALGL